MKNSLNKFDKGSFSFAERLFFFFFGLFYSMKAESLAIQKWQIQTNSFAKKIFLKKFWNSGFWLRRNYHFPNIKNLSSELIIKERKYFALLFCGDPLEIFEEVLSWEKDSKRTLTSESHKRINQNHPSFNQHLFLSHRSYDVNIKLHFKLSFLGSGTKLKSLRLKSLDMEIKIDFIKLDALKP